MPASSISEFLKVLSEVSTFVIAVCGAMHVVAFFFLWMWYRRDLRRITATLDDFTRGLKHRSVLDRDVSFSDQIDAFVSDVTEILDNPGLKTERTTLLQRINILDEKRRYLQSLGFETAYNFWRSMIEAYPLAGILGTILAIGAALEAGKAASVSVIVQRFGEAIWSTCAGLVCAILLMFLNSLIETSILRLSENRLHVRQMIAKAKHALIHAEGNPG
jgi:biopolymer transport protein ExbB/TolQ